VTTVRAAAVQLSPVLYSRDGTVERVVAKIDELATRGVQFVTFPETVVPYYPYFSFVLLNRTVTAIEDMGIQIIHTRDVDISEMRGLLRVLSAAW
jgi:predicted amidohydrolase